MNLSMNSRSLASVQIQSVSLRPLLGAYDLLFGLYLKVKSDAERRRRALIAGARISIKGTGNERHALGFARPEAPLVFTTGPSESPASSALALPLQPGQLAALENLRGTGDLDFEILIMGIGSDQHGDTQIQDTWSIHVPRSAWIKTLKAAKARDILLLEVPLPLGKRPEMWAAVEKELTRAEEHFRNGDYHACVASCRTVLQELGQHKFKNKDWAAPILDRLATGRGDMTKHERVASIWGALRHYTHLAHHGDSEGGETDYSRAEAQMVLTMTASFVAHAQAA